MRFNFTARISHRRIESAEQRRITSAPFHNSKELNQQESMEPVKPVFFVEGEAHPDQHLQNTVRLMLESDAWISITLKEDPINGLAVDVKSANLSAEQLNQILQYSVTATSGPPSSQN